MALASDDAVYQGLAEAKRDEFETRKEKDSSSQISSSAEHELDGIHDGLEFPTRKFIAHDLLNSPTDHDITTQRRSKRLSVVLQIEFLGTLTVSRHSHHRPSHSQRRSLAPQ